MFIITKVFKVWKPYLLYVTTLMVVLTDYLNYNYLIKKIKLLLK